MFKKVSENLSSIKKLSNTEVQQTLADEEIVSRLTKLANGIRQISPKSDEFLYFSIVFLKAAESATLDENGFPKKIANGETAWGYFDDNWRWHGNVLPHRNNNSDIFPESELKKAASRWIGLPLCKDHQSSSVDGIRGIILDTHYDEKYKQVVGLCALDKINYPDLARKVETGQVRYGSMGTAVERSICSECGNIATTPSSYCDHIQKRSAHGEINVGLNPIEYSLVVQPAEPQAILLKCIASLQNYRDEFKANGISDVDDMLGKLSFNQAQHLEKIMKTACGPEGCSIDSRNKIINSFFENNKGLIKNSHYSEDTVPTDVGEFNRNMADAAEKADKLGDSGLRDSILRKLKAFNENYKPESDDVTYSEPVMQDSIANPGEQNELGTTEEEVGITQNYPNSETLVSVGSLNQTKIRSSIKSILEGFMNDSRLKKRAELRRKLAYMQGGAEGEREPAGFQAEEFPKEEDKQMKQTESDFAGDKEKKEMLSRAQLQERAMRRLAYMQGGAEGEREPAGFQAEEFSKEEDKQMKQTETDFSGDMQMKEQLKRAAAKYRGISKTSKYTGPSLSTQMRYVKTASGSIDKSSSRFEVYAGTDRVISVPVGDIFGKEASANWEWVNSSDYGKKVCKYVRAYGIEKTDMILKGAQEAPAPEMEEAPEMEMPEAPEMEMAGEMPEAPEMDMAPEAPEAPEAEEMEGDDEEPAAAAEARLSEIESLIDELRDLIDQIQDKTKMADVDIHVDVGGAKEDEEMKELSALASEALGQLKKIAVELDESADEVAMISETYDNLDKISKDDRVKFRKLASEAIKDSDEVVGEAKATIKLASSIAKTFISKKASMHEAMDDLTEQTHMAEDEMEDDAQEDLIAEAMLLRRNRREALLKQAEQRVSETAVVKTAELETATAELETATAEVAETSIGRIKQKLNESMTQKTANEEKERYKVKLRRAYDVGLDMQKKGLIAQTKTALDRQVDEIMNFDDKAFESFKRSIANMKPVSNVKIASDLNGLNVGIQEQPDFDERPKGINSNLLSAMWDK